MAKNLTEIQRKILEFLVDKIGSGLPPTLAEIAENFGYKNRATVQQHLQAIEKKGFIKRNPKLSRGIELMTESRFFASKPILGEVAAGNPLTIYPDAIDSVDLPNIAYMPKDSFLLKVKGDSLKDAYIFSGDIVIVNPNLEPRNGQFAVAILEDAAVVKRFKKVEHGIELHSENEEYKPIFIADNETSFTMVGVVVGIYRSMELN
ncbi:MAG: repressor LexA [Tenericutes bacterium]|nr:repressor LexA [Mycoplasmatota bacterium]MBI9009668.1 repressor LexA [Mycoplasmatota bacterium]